MKFLIVDDDLDMACFISATLVCAGVSSDIAESAGTARELYRRNGYDALIVDAILAGDSGICLARELRVLRRDIPVMFCSGADDAFNRKLMWSLGMVCHKPLDERFPLDLRRFMRSFA